MVGAKRAQATYADVVSAPPHMVAELMAGELSLQPRPAVPHAGVSSGLGALLGGPFQFGRGGPGGWLIYDEPELHLGEDVLVPDLAGWRAERLAPSPIDRLATTPPDWVCEVLSPSTYRHDRVRKLPRYARAGVAYAWLVDPIQRTIEAMRLADGQWVVMGTWAEEDVAPIAPFEAVPLELGLLWASSPPLPGL